MANPVSGNVTFYTQPSGVRQAEWALNDSFFHSVPAATLAQARQTTSSFVAAGEQVVRRRIAALQNAVQASAITIEACSPSCRTTLLACVAMLAV